MEPFLHPYPIFSILRNLTFLTWRTPKIKVPEILPGALSSTQIEPTEPKRPKIDPYLDHEIGIHMLFITLPIGALIWVALIWVTFPSEPKSCNPPQITKKHFINILLLPKIYTFWDMDPFQHLDPKFLALPNSTFLTQKFELPKILPCKLSPNKIEPKKPKRSLIDPHIDHKTGCCVYWDIWSGQSVLPSQYR